MYTSSAPYLLESVQTSRANNDLEEMANQIHGFKTKLIMMGMNHTKDLAVIIENQCREKRDIKHFSSEIDDLVENITSSIEELKYYIK